MGWADAATVLVLLLACLVALVLVFLARREAEAARRQANHDVESIRDEARGLLADAQRRVDRAVEREVETRQERAEARAAQEAAAAARAEAVQERAAAAAALDGASAPAEEGLANVTGM